jgi:hypothetical protein
LGLQSELDDRAGDRVSVIRDHEPHDVVAFALE